MWMVDLHVCWEGWTYLSAGKGEPTCLVGRVDLPVWCGGWAYLSSWKGGPVPPLDEDLTFEALEVLAALFQERVDLGLREPEPLQREVPHRTGRHPASNLTQLTVLQGPDLQTWNVTIRRIEEASTVSTSHYGV